VMVNAPEDDVAEGTRTFVVEYELSSADGNYDGKTGSVVIEVEDNDDSGIELYRVNADGSVVAHAAAVSLESLQSLVAVFNNSSLPNATPPMFDAPAGQGVPIAIAAEAAGSCEYGVRLTSQPLSTVVVTVAEGEQPNVTTSGCTPVGASLSDGPIAGGGFLLEAYSLATIDAALIASMHSSLGEEQWSMLVPDTMG